MATTNEIYSLYLAYFGRPPDAVGFAAAQSKTPAQLQAEFSASAESSALLASTNLGTQVNNIYVNAFGRSAETAGLLYWVGEIAANRVTLSQAAFTIVSSALNDDRTTVTNKITAATAFYAQVVASPANIIGYSGNAASAQARTFLSSVTSSAATVTAAVAGAAAAVTSTVAAGSAAAVTPGSTFTLTTSANTELGTAGNDTFVGVIGTSLGATDGTTLNPGDNLSGGSAGNDTLQVSISGTHAGAIVDSAFTLTSIENLAISNFETSGSNTTLDLSLANGVTSIKLTASSDTGDTLLTGVKSLATAAMENGAGDLSITYVNTAVAGSADTQALSLSGVTAGTFTVAPTSGSESVETIAVTSSGSARNVLTEITDNSDTKTITVDGTQALTVTNAIGGSVTALNASANTGGLTAIVSNASTTVTGASGNDAITVTVQMGTGSVAAGTGTTDALTLRDTIANGSTTNTGDTIISSTTQGAKFTGFETLNISQTDGGNAATVTAYINRVQDVSQIAGINTIGLTTYSLAQTANDDTDTATSVTYNNLSAAVQNLNISGLAYTGTDGTNDDDVTLTVAANLAANTAADSITVTLGTSTAAAGNAAAAVAGTDDLLLDVTLGSFETISLVSQGANNTITQLTAGELKTLNVSGSKNLTITTITGNTATTAIDASTMTGALIIGTNNGTTASTIQGGSGNDSLVGGSAADRITSGAGADSVVGAAGSDIIEGGAGNDTIDAGAGVDNVNSGDGDDTINVTTTTDFIGLTAAETIVGGEGNDNLVISQAATAISLTAADLTGVSGIDRLTINGTSAAGSVIVSDAIYTANGVSTLRVIDGDLTQGTLTVNAAALTGTNAIQVTANSSTTVNDTLTGGAGADTFVFATATGLQAADSVTGGAGTDVISLDASAAVSADLSGVRTVEQITTTGNGGNVSVTVGNDSTIATTGTLTTNASSITNNAFALTYDGSAETTATTFQNVTGTAGNDTIGLGGGNDIAVGGDGGDGITGAGGVDNLSGGAGNDTFTVGTVAHFVGLSAVETVSGGAGTDTLSFSVGNNAMTIAASDLLGINSVETISIVSGNATAALTVTDSVFTANGATTLAITNATTSTTGVQVSAAGISATNSIQFTGTTVAAVNDSVVGGLGNDSFTFSTAAAANALTATDSVDGGAGNDLLTISTGTTALTALTLTAVANIERLTVSGTTGGVGTITLADANFASVTGATINATSLTTGALLLTASAEDDSSFNITSGGGADSIVGGQLADTINAGSGVDTIQGGLLADSLTGGTGADVFEYTLVTHSNGTNTDSITDFTSGTDKLNVTLDYSALVSALTVDATVQTARAGTTLAQDNLSGNRGQAVYDTTGSALFINVNADNLLTTSDYKININPASTATATIAEGDINFVITGGTNADVITAGGGADTINGGTGGGDFITAGAGADAITVAAAGSDTIIGGQGADTIELTATGAADTIRFASASGTAGTAAAATSLGIDVITNFTGGTDILNFSEAAFGNLNGGAGVAALDETQVIVLANTTTAMNTANAQIDGAGGVTVTNGAFAVVGTNAAANTVALYFITSGADVTTTIAAGVAAGTVVQIATVGVIGSALALGGFIGIA